MPLCGRQDPLMKRPTMVLDANFSLQNARSEHRLMPHNHVVVGLDKLAQGQLARRVNGGKDAADMPIMLDDFHSMAVPVLVGVGEESEAVIR